MKFPLRLLKVAVSFPFLCDPKVLNLNYLLYLTEFMSICLAPTSILIASYLFLIDTTQAVSTSKDLWILTIYYINYLKLFTK